MAEKARVTLVIANIRNISPERLVRVATGKVYVFVLYMHNNHNDVYLTLPGG